MKLTALQSFVLWAACTAIPLQLVGLSNGNDLDRQITVLMFTIFAIWPLWLAWRFAKFLWKLCSVASMTVDQKRDDMLRERQRHA